jgi:hypothetical protein
MSSLGPWRLIERISEELRGVKGAYRYWRSGLSSLIVDMIKST